MWGGGGGGRAACPLAVYICAGPDWFQARPRCPRSFLRVELMPAQLSKTKTKNLRGPLRNTVLGKKEQFENRSRRFLGCNVGVIGVDIFFGSSAVREGVAPHERGRRPVGYQGAALLCKSTRGGGVGGHCEPECRCPISEKSYRQLKVSLGFVAIDGTYVRSYRNRLHISFAGHLPLNPWHNYPYITRRT